MTLGRRRDYYDEDDLDADSLEDDDLYLDEEPERRGRGDLDRYRPASATRRHFWARLLAGVLAIVVTFWALALTAEQLTSPEVALPAHQRAVEALTGLREVLEIHEDEIRTLAANLPPSQEVELPGLPVLGVTVTAEELDDGGPEEWHVLIVGRAADITYTQGAAAFHDEEVEPQGGFLSATNALMRLLDTVSADGHERFGGFVYWLGILALVLAAAMLIVGEGIRRLVPAGAALIAAGVLVALASFVAMGIVIAAGNENSAVATELTAIARTYARAPLQNAIWLVVAGFAIALPAYIGSMLFDPRETRDDVDAEIQRAW